MINRPYHYSNIKKSLNRSPITALLGPRQCGKTTLARLFEKEENALYLDLESLPDRQRLQNPELMLGSARGLVILDEIQQMPQLFSALRVLVDRPDNEATYLILGSASPDIVKSASETLAGRVEFIELSAFNLMETGPSSAEKLWLRGGFPRSFLAASEEDSYVWRQGFIRTFLERDIPQLGINIPSTAMHRFWTMLAHFHGQLWNASELGRSLGLSDKTVRSYLDILTGTFMIRQLQPWHENISKRQVKAPKIYLRDTGLLHNLLGISNLHDLMGHPRAGASWEGFALEQVLQSIRPDAAYFWATYTGAEVDLFFIKEGKRYGIEFKMNEAPKITKSMYSALADLGLEHLWVIYPGKDSYPVEEKITAWPLSKTFPL